MATLYKRGQVWYIDFRYKGKRYQRSLKTKNKQAARLILADFEIKIAKGRMGILEAEPLELEELAEKYLAYCRANRYARHTISTYKSRARAILAFFANSQISQITPERIEQFKAQRTTQITAVGVNSELNLLRAMIRKAIQWDYLKENPFATVKPLRTDKKQIRFLSREEIVRLKDAAENYTEYPPIKAMVLVMLYTGLRIGEVRALTWNDIDLANGLLYVQPKDEHSVKSRKPRTVPISHPELLDALKALPRGDSPYLFSLRRAQCFTHFKRVARRAGLAWVTPHTLRHTFASYLAMQGASMRSIQELLGHASLVTTQQYQHLTPGYQRGVIELLDFSSVTKLSQRKRTQKDINEHKRT